MLDRVLALICNSVELTRAIEFNLQYRFCNYSSPWGWESLYTSLCTIHLFILLYNTRRSIHSLYQHHSREEFREQEPRNPDSERTFRRSINVYILALNLWEVYFRSHRTDLTSPVSLPSTGITSAPFIHFNSSRSNSRGHSVRSTHTHAHCHDVRLRSVSRHHTLFFHTSLTVTITVSSITLSLHQLG